jgi:hypothetical protein
VPFVRWHAASACSVVAGVNSHDEDDVNSHDEGHKQRPSLQAREECAGAVRVNDRQSRWA